VRGKLVVIPEVSLMRYMFDAMAMCAASTMSFAAVKFSCNPQSPSNGKELVANIVGVDYEVASTTEEQSILIMLKADDKLNESNLQGGTITLTGKDLSLGMALAASIGKKVAVSTNDENLPRVLIITDEYWNGSEK
jgi:hypothetical protein